MSRFPSAHLFGNQPKLKLAAAACFLCVGAACSLKTHSDKHHIQSPAIAAAHDQEKSTMAKLGMPTPKRVAPPTVSPISVGPYRYEPILWGRDRGLGQNGGYLAVMDAASNQEVALIKVYGIEYNQELETDVQDVFFKSMELQSNGNRLLITDERARRYSVDLATRAIQALP